MKYIALITLALLLAGCNDKSKNMTEFYKIYGNDSVEVQELFTIVSEQIVFFGHQSVGDNILYGISTLEEDSNVKLNRVTAREWNTPDTPAFIDFRVGQNGDVYSKIDDFISVVKGIPEGNSAIAFFKLCYVDVGAGSDINKIFDYYKSEMLKLKGAASHVNIALMTVPLTTVQKGWKATVKKALKKSPAGYLDNVQRQEINERILSELSDDFPIFDLAKIESTLPAGDQSSFKYEGNSVSNLAKIYTSDNGQPNEFGSKIIAHNMLAFLAEEFK